MEIFSINNLLMVRQIKKCLDIIKIQSEDMCVYFYVNLCVGTKSIAELLYILYFSLELLY